MYIIPFLHTVQDVLSLSCVEPIFFPLTPLLTSSGELPKLYAGFLPECLPVFFLLFPVCFGASFLGPRWSIGAQD